MKTVLILSVLAALVSIDSNAAIIAQPRSNLIVGVIGSGDSLLARQQLRRNAIANTIQSEDFIYRGSSRTNITSVRAIEQGYYTQYANPMIISGGVGRSNVTVRVQSSRGYGYDVMVEIYGRY